MSSRENLNNKLSKKTDFLGLKPWELVGIGVGVVSFVVLFLLLVWFTVRKRRRTSNNLPVTQIPSVSKEIKEVQSETLHNKGFIHHDGLLLAIHDKLEDEGYVNMSTIKIEDGSNRSGSFNHLENSQSVEGSSEKIPENKLYSPHNNISFPSPLLGLPEFSQLGWGHWFTLRDLELATNGFSKKNIIGEGGYGVVYHGRLMNGSPVAVKKILNNLGQAEKEFRVEVEAIGHVRHKNLVRLLGYCIEGTHRMLVYEYVNNGNLEQWLRGKMGNMGYLTWEARMKILLGTAKGISYLHEAIDPKVVHRDIKSSNILIDDDFNAKISDFGLAKLLGAGKSHVATRVMGTFGYVAPEYANSGLLNEKSDVYSYGVVLLEVITGREPVSYEDPDHQVNLIDWIKMMVGSKRSEEVLDPNINTKPSTKAVKRALLTALRCVDQDSNSRPQMSQVVRMLENNEYPVSHEDRRHKNVPS